MYSNSITIKILFLCCLFFGACNSNPSKINYNNPAKVALFFSKAIAQQDIDRAKLVSTASTHQVLNILQTLQDAQTDKKVDVEATAATVKAIKKAKCTVENDKALCTICCMEEDTEATESEGLHLIREDDKWLVHMAKESLRTPN